MIEEDGRDPYNTCQNSQCDHESERDLQNEGFPLQGSTLIKSDRVAKGKQDVFAKDSKENLARVENLFECWSVGVLIKIQSEPEEYKNMRI